MKKTLKLLILGLISCVMFFVWTSVSNTAYADIIIGDASSTNLNIGNYASEGDHVRKNKKLEKIWDNPEFVEVTSGWEKGLYHTLVRFARDLKNLFFAMATVFFLIIVLRLILSSNSDEELANFKKWVIWITIWIIIMQLAYSLTLILFDRWVNESLGFRLIDNMIYPLLSLLETLAAVFFLAMAVYAFYRLITANGAEDKIKSGKMTILYSIIGFVVIRFAKTIVESVYGRLDCDNNIAGIITVEGGRCLTEADVTGWIEIIITIINWMNSFVWLAVVLMIIYAGFNILISNWDEEKLKKGKTTMIYIGIGLLLLVMNYLILTFFLIPQATI